MTAPPSHPDASPADAPAPGAPALSDLSRRGLRLLVGAVAMLVVIGGGMLVWILDKAARNPDVRTERPGWLDAAVGFDVSFWIPLALTVGVGGVLVFAVYVTAIRRLRAGEDLYAQRHGKGVRRHGERAIDADGGWDRGRPRT